MTGKHIYEQFSQASPVAVMVRASLAWALPDSYLDEIFAKHAEQQRPSELLFSTIVELMSLVVTRSCPSVHAAYKQRAAAIGVAIKSIYNKLNGVETSVSRALVRETASRFSEVIRTMKGGRAPLLPGYQVRILDGNHLASTEHRLKKLRTNGSAPLPGLALAVLDPDQMLITDVFPCEDAHTQERKIVLDLVEHLEANQLWIADRNFCTSVFLWEVHQQQASYLVRQHATSVRWEPRGENGKESSSSQADASLRETPVWILDDHGNRMEGRRITIVLDKPTRHDEREIHLLTNLPKAVRAAKVAELYRERWTIEGAFSELATALHSEIDTLAYPKAALLGFCVGLLSYNLMSICKAAMRRIQGDEVAEQLSAFFLAEEVRATWKGLHIMLSDAFWSKRFSTMKANQLAKELLQLAKLVELRKYTKSPRGPKKPRPPRSSAKRHPHVSTARILGKK